MNYPTLPSQPVKPVSGNRAAILAEKYCCNWHNHVCVGTEVDLSTGLQARWRPEGSRCLLADGKRCPYFEQSVLPMERWDWKNPSEGAAFKNIAHTYRIQIVKEKTSQPAPFDIQWPERWGMNFDGARARSSSGGDDDGDAKTVELTPEKRERVLRYLDEVDLAVSGQGGSNPTYRAANVFVWGFGGRSGAPVHADVFSEVPATLEHGRDRAQAC